VIGAGFRLPGDRLALTFVLDEIRWLGKTPAAVELDALLPWNPALRKKLEN
jgi:hypothetical protein